MKIYNVCVYKLMVNYHIVVNCKHLLSNSKMGYFM